MVTEMTELEAALTLITALGTGNAWALVSWGNAWLKDEKFSLRKLLRLEILALSAATVAIVMNITPGQGMSFLLLNGGIPIVDKAVAFIEKWVNYKEPTPKEG